MKLWRLQPLLLTHTSTLNHLWLPQGPVRPFVSHPQHEPAIVLCMGEHNHQTVITEVHVPGSSFLLSVLSWFFVTDRLHLLRLALPLAMKTSWGVLIGWAFSVQVLDQRSLTRPYYVIVILHTMLRKAGKPGDKAIFSGVLHGTYLSTVSSYV